MDVPDNFDQFESHERKQEAQLRKRPVCSHCFKRIQDERLFDIEGTLYHQDCFEELFLNYTEDYEA